MSGVKKSTKATVAADEGNPHPETVTNTTAVATVPEKPVDQPLAAPAIISSPSGALSVQGQIAEDFAAFEGAGMEKLTAADLLIPRLSIIQALSDQMKRTSPNYIDGAKVGEIVDTGTNEIMPAKLRVLPVVWDKTWIEWYPRSTRKGIANIHLTADILAQTEKDAKGKPILKNGNYVAETAQVYLLNLDAGRRPSFLPFASSQTRKSRRWMTLASGERLERADGSEYCPPLFYRSYVLGTQMESNNEGEWGGWTIERGPALPELPNWKNILNDAIKFRDSIIAGSMVADISSMSDDPTVINQHDGGERNSSGPAGDEPPPADSERM